MKETLKPVGLRVLDGEVLEGNIRCIMECSYSDSVSHVYLAYTSYHRPTDSGMMLERIAILLWKKLAQDIV